jgi:hypothetical protein
MSSLPDRSESPRWPADEPRPSGIDWGEVIALALAVATVVAFDGAIILWCLGLL